MINDKPRNCPWCAKQPVIIQDKGDNWIACANSECRVKPISNFYPEMQQALDAWNNPQRSKSRTYTEENLKEIFSELFIDNFTWNYFFPETELYKCD